MNTLAPSYLIEFSSLLQVTRTNITSRTNLKFGQIGLRTAELADLERLEKSPLTYDGENVVTTLAPSFFKIIFIFAGNENIHESLNEFEFRPDTTTDPGVICTWASEQLMHNVVNILAPSFWSDILHFCR